MRIYVELIIATIKSFVNNFLFFIYQLGFYIFIIFSKTLDMITFNRLNVNL